MKQHVVPSFVIIHCVPKLLLLFFVFIFTTSLSFNTIFNNNNNTVLVHGLSFEISRRTFAAQTIASTTTTTGFSSITISKQKIMSEGGEGSAPKKAKIEKPSLVVAVIGYTGGVGKCLIKAMKQINLQPYALVRSSTMKIGFDKDDDSKVKEVPVDYDELITQLLKQASSNANGIASIPVIADVTASTDLQEKYYSSWLSKGISICTANKGIFAGDEDTYNGLLAAASSSNNVKLLHEATVGAGLPVLSTLQTLQQSSHKITKVEGVLSGTLAYVLGAVAGGKMTLSSAVIKAKELGYTEPDPRMDLNGLDVARKAIILARKSGMQNVELSKLDVESLVPKALEDCSVDEFLEKLSQYDDEFATRVAKVEAEEDGKRLHYAANVDVTNNKITVGPMACEASHPFNAAGSDNLIAIHTNYYAPRPLVIQGAGAGGDVTATGVLGDILSLQN